MTSSNALPPPGTTAAAPAELHAECPGRVGLLTLDRVRAMNALSLPMVRALTARLLAWRDDPQVLAVAIRGMGKGPTPEAAPQPFGLFCAGGDIRFFHQAALAGDPALEDFFTEEYQLNHLIHHYPKPFIAFMDGIVMGGGMGIAQGASLRVVTERSKLAMPETQIGLFPDVGGGYFLSRCPGRWGEYLGLTGQALGADEAVAVGLADGRVASAQQVSLWQALANPGLDSGAAAEHLIATHFIATEGHMARDWGQIDACFSAPDVPAIAQALQADGSDWAQATLAQLRQRSPLMLHVVLAQVRRARSLSLAEDLRMERDLVRHCFRRPDGAPSETVEGIRALAIDKDHQPRWQDTRLEDVRPAQVAAFFDSPWPAHAHPLRHLA